MSSHHEFVVGSTYQDRLGKYCVISVSDGRMVVEYSDGTRRDSAIADKWRIHSNIVSEVNLPTVVRPARHTKRHDGSGFFTHDEVFPIIAEVIEAFSGRSGEFMDHRTLVEAFMEHREAQLILNRPHNKTDAWWAANMVAWFSKVFTDGNSAWDNTFERIEIDGAWAYRKCRGAKLVRRRHA